jgi:hypothetical protein
VVSDVVVSIDSWEYVPVLRVAGGYKYALVDKPSTFGSRRQDQAPVPKVEDIPGHEDILLIGLSVRGYGQQHG